MHDGMGNECEFECVIRLESGRSFYRWRCCVEN